MAIEIFNRYENKYMLDTDTYEKLLARLSDYMEPDAYNKSGRAYTICNVYYDTPDNHLIRTSLQKPSYKEKLRLRSYGAAEADTPVYLEIKKKYRGLVGKRRSAILTGDAERLIETGELPEIADYMNGQVLNEAAYLLSHKKLRPAVYLAYERMAWFGTGQHDLRISFDSNIVTRRDNLTLRAIKGRARGEPLIGPNQRLMEIKVARNIPLWLSHLLAEYRIYPVSFSKYGREYQNRLIARESSQVCVIMPPIEKFAEDFVKDA